ncbi:GrpB family protein [Bacillus sp. EAC]|uniref:GrpB family protein n=1 Tax=Bacillus sp. EAC TaxID=1978338 RepID=UPI000B4411A4|nr:GrpB family protein [Bacillus sp. EAC]
MSSSREVNVVVTNYDENWVKLFTIEAKKIREVLGNEIIDIHHIGSTSVPNLKAKPIIDLMPIVKNINQVDHFNSKMAEIGYEGLGEFGLEGRRYFRKGGVNRTHHVHIYQYDNEEQINRHLAFRNYLRSHSDVAFAYGELKERLAREFPKDIEGYMDGKDSFVKNVEHKAIEWKKLRGE